MAEVALNNLPFISLLHEQVEEALLRVIPIATAEKFQVVAFADDGKNLKIAIVNPERLKAGFVSTLAVIGQRIGREIKLYRTDLPSLTAVLRQGTASPENHFSAPAVSASKSLPSLPKQSEPDRGVTTGTGPFSGQVSTSVRTQVIDPRQTEDKAAEIAPQKEEKIEQVSLTPGESLAMPLPNLPELPVADRVEPIAATWPIAPEPPLFQVDTLVAYNYLRRVPLQFAKRERVACVDHLPPNTYWFVTDGTNDRRLVPAVRYISEKNGIVAHVRVLPKESFERLLSYYEKVQAEEDKLAEPEKMDKKIDDKEEAEITASLTAMSTPGPVQDNGITAPTLKGKIILAEEERQGLAGFIQRISQNFTASELEDTPEHAPMNTTTAAPPPTVSVGQSAQAATAPVSASQSAQSSAPGLTAVNLEPASGSTTNATLIADQDDLGKVLGSSIDSIDQLKDLIRAGNVPKMVASIVSYAISQNASDIHLEPFEDELRIRYRIDGILMDILKLPPDTQSPLVSRIKILSRLRLDENRIPQDGRFDVKFDEKRQVDIRVSVMPTANGEKVVMRLLDKSRGVTSIEDLGIEGIGYKWLTQSIQKPYGICLATGPTGSGKSTTLYAILQRIATPNVNVVTLEDPIEYNLKGVNQSQIRPKIGFTFAEGLRSILRQDPNIIMVGEIRDGETANMATQAALTGHLVLSTLHTNDAAGAIPRLTNMGIEPFLITSSLNMVLGQRLVRRICPHCKQPVNLPEGVKAGLEADIHEVLVMAGPDSERVKEPISFFQGTGCDKCHGRGYLGRVGIYEVLVMDDHIEDLTINRASGAEIQEEARKHGMVTMYQDGLLKAAAGITTIDEVLREAKAS